MAEERPADDRGMNVQEGVGGESSRDPASGRPAVGAYSVALSVRTVTMGS